MRFQLVSSTDHPYLSIKRGFLFFSLLFALHLETTSQDKAGSRLPSAHKPVKLDEEGHPRRLQGGWVGRKKCEAWVGWDWDFMLRRSSKYGYITACKQMLHEEKEQPVWDEIWKQNTWSSLCLWQGLTVAPLGPMGKTKYPSYGWEPLRRQGS